MLAGAFKGFMGTEGLFDHNAADGLLHPLGYLFAPISDASVTSSDTHSWKPCKLRHRNNLD